MINIADLLLENNTASERPNNDNPIVDYSDNHEKIDNDTKVEDNEPLDEHFGFTTSDYFGYYVSDKGNLNGNCIDEDLTYKNEFQAIRFYLNSGKDEGDCYLYATKKEEPNTLILLGKININDKGEEVGYNFLNENYNYNNCQIYSMFAGVGKNYAINELKKSGYKVYSIEKERDFYENRYFYY